MTTNKERIEMLEQGVRGLQDEVQRLGLGMNDIMQRLEESLKALSDVVLSSKAIQSLPSVKQRHTSHYQPDETDYCLNIPTLRAKIEFPRFVGDDPTEWFNILNFKELLKIKRCAWQLSTWKEKQTSGGNG
jgi:hypothetical protein